MKVQNLKLLKELDMLSLENFTIEVKFLGLRNSKTFDIKDLYEWKKDEHEVQQIIGLCQRVTLFMQDKRKQELGPVIQVVKVGKTPEGNMYAIGSFSIVDMFNHFCLLIYDQESGEMKLLLNETLNYRNR